jgi:hypothetical protein
VRHSFLDDPGKRAIVGEIDAYAQSTPSTSARA